VSTQRHVQAKPVTEVGALTLRDTNLEYSVASIGLGQHTQALLPLTPELGSVEGLHLSSSVLGSMSSQGD
jgi:hypothetical protein